jgi:beta-ribofuranosylaminobenzene 5'-phosphate synthase
MICVQAASRLHFGLLSLPSADDESNHAGGESLATRRFGGVGLMVQQPGIRLTVQPAATWSADGPLGARALAFARQFAQAVPPATVTPQHLIIERCAPEHAGLGTGTQLGLAVARALTTAFELPALDAVELARRVGRGRRSALGIHGFAQGGFLVEAGQRRPDAIAPLVAHLSYPEEWRVVLVVPRDETGLHGLAERQAFERLQAPGSASVTDALCRLIVLGLLPALVERDLEAFGDALFEFNVRVGERFAAVQGGVYASPRLAEMVAFARREGIRGVGQSSWGPALFAVTAGEDQAQDFAGRVRTRFGLQGPEVLTTLACNQGATCESLR